MQDGAYYHHQSGWIFPAQIDDFSLVGIPGDINGTVDVAGYYARVSKGIRTVASVNVYAPDSAQPETTPASIKATPVAVEIATRPRLRATKLIYKDGKNSRATVYFIDTGTWIVKIRASAPATDKEIGALLEKFVRNQRWDRLQISSKGAALHIYGGYSPVVVLYQRLNASPIADNEDGVGLRQERLISG
jgi:hypothetical protein